LEKFNDIVRIQIGAVVAALGLLIGYLISSNPMEMILIAFLVFILGLSVVPRVLFVFAKPKWQIYLLSGSIGLAFVKLSIIVFTSDGKLTKNEVEKLKKYMGREFGYSIIEPLMGFVSENKVIGQGIHQICESIAQLKTTSKIELIYQLLLMVSTDRLFNRKEENSVREIAGAIKIGEKRFEIIKNRVLKEKTDIGNHEYAKKGQYQNFRMEQLLKMAYNPYKVLEIDSNATDLEVKKAYRLLVKKFHPDKSMQENEKIRKHDSDKIIEINQAYESIKKMRGIR
jgi:DnaJ like chaperone protein